MRELTKTTLHIVATIAALPALLSYAIRRPLLGADRALEGSTEALGLLPGLLGVYVRRAFLCQTLAHCDRSASVHFGTLFSQAGARLDANVYVGPRCHLGWVHVEPDVLIAAGVHVPSGSATHGTKDVDIPIREQGGERTLVTIGRGSWVGSGAIIMADVGRHCVIAAGSVVTRPIPDYAIAAGVPARVLRDRRDGPVAVTEDAAQ